MFTEIELRFLYENEKAVKVISVDGLVEAFIAKICFNNYGEDSYRRGGIYPFEIMTCVLKKKKLI